MDQDSELNACELGTQEYWDLRYKSEIKNFEEFGDVGEIWFGEDIVERIIRWMHKTPLVENTHSIIDIGCGNGMFLVELAKEGFTNLLGVDYSSDAIELAKSIAKKEQLNINYNVIDVLDSNLTIEEFDLAFDKGTYDAISLSENSKDKRSIYIENVHKIVKNEGLLLITTCNWTKDEIVQHFEGKFKQIHIIPTPQFKFGGQVGNVVSIIVFKKI